VWRDERDLKVCACGVAARLLHLCVCVVCGAAGRLLALGGCGRGGGSGVSLCPQSAISPQSGVCVCGVCVTGAAMAVVGHVARALSCVHVGVFQAVVGLLRSLSP